MKTYPIIIDTMEEVHCTTHDEYGLRAKGVLAALNKFDIIYFGIKLAHLLHGPSEETSKVLQAKSISLQEALASVNATKCFYINNKENF